MIITRYAHCVEFEIEGQRKVSIDVRCVHGAALTAERQGGDVVNTLHLMTESGLQRIEGGPQMLAAVHQTLIEAMIDLADEDCSANSDPASAPTERTDRSTLH